MRAATKPICANCKHFNNNLKYPRCKAISFVNLINGTIMPADCHPERTQGTKCGPEGKLFARAA